MPGSTASTVPETRLKTETKKELPLCGIAQVKKK